MHRFIQLFLLVSIASVLYSPVSAQEEVDETYLLRPGDIITVQVFGQPDLQIQQEISSAGGINLGLIGPVVVGRLTLSQAEGKIRQAYIDQQFLRNPQIIIGVQQYSQKLVTILGAVNRPGSVAFDRDANSMPLSRVISQVGGFQGIAKTDAVRVVRTDENDKEQSIILDMSDIGKRNSKNKDLNFLVYPDDVIYVPERIF